MQKYGTRAQLFSNKPFLFLDNQLELREVEDGE